MNTSFLLGIINWVEELLLPGFKSEWVTVQELQEQTRNGIKQWVQEPCYRIEDPEECEARIKDTYITVKKLCQEFKLKSISRDFD